METKQVTVVTVTYGNRWKFLSQVVTAVMQDSLVTKLVIVDNGSRNKGEIERGVAEYGDRVTVLRLEKNLGSAGGFACGLEYVRGLNCDFVLMLDDDNAPEPEAVSMFIKRYDYIGGEPIVCGFRPDIQDSSIFTFPPKGHDRTKTFFHVWSTQKVQRFFRKITGTKEHLQSNGHYPIIPAYGFVYGGAFLPIEAVRKAPLPDKELVLYGDDVEYSWGVFDVGHTSYLCDRPIIRDVDLSFESGDHILGLFNKKTEAFKVYFRIRNMVRISRRNTTQQKIALHSSVVIWIMGLFVMGVLRYGITPRMLGRIKLILQAVYGGYVKGAQVPHAAQLP